MTAINLAPGSTSFFVRDFIAEVQNKLRNEFRVNVFWAKHFIV